MRTMILAAAGSALLALAPAVWAQELDTGAQAYRTMNSTADNSYGSSGHAGAAAGAHDGAVETSWFGAMTVISPDDPAYSYTEAPHRGQPAEWEFNGDDGGRGTSYPAILGHDSGQ